MLGCHYSACHTMLENLDFIIRVIGSFQKCFQEGYGTIKSAFLEDPTYNLRELD